MSERFKDQVVFITGGARGQGRSHAEAFAKEGADVVVCDIADQIDVVPFAMATEADLAKTRELVEATGRSCLARKADVRDRAGLKKVADEALERFGSIDVLVANAGITAHGRALEMSQEKWQTVLDTNLTGVWNAVRAVAPSMVERGYGRIIATTSALSRQPAPNSSAYICSKVGVHALVKCLSLELYQQGITVNGIAPQFVLTDMVRNDEMYRLFRPDLENPTEADAMEVWETMNPYGDTYVEREDVSEGVLFLASAAAARITGTCLDVQGGYNAGVMP